MKDCPKFCLTLIPSFQCPSWLTRRKQLKWMLIRQKRFDHPRLQVNFSKWIQSDRCFLAPVYVFSGGVVKSNEKLTELTSLARALLRETVEAINKLKMWIVFLIPRIEDGNNFGVSIQASFKLQSRVWFWSFQEEALNEVRTVESETATFYDQVKPVFKDLNQLFKNYIFEPFILTT